MSKSKLLFDQAVLPIPLVANSREELLKKIPPRDQTLLAICKSKGYSEVEYKSHIYEETKDGKKVYKLDYLYDVYCKDEERVSQLESIIKNKKG